MPNVQHPYQAVMELCQKQGVTLVVVTKTRTLDEIRRIYDLGHRIFAENRAQDLVTKAAALPGDIEWHLIGHLQQNKVRMVLPYVSCIQSVDSERIWTRIREETERISKKVDILIQIKIATEQTKFGWDFSELTKYLNSEVYQESSLVNIRGVMGMTTLTQNEVQIREEMNKLKTHFQHLKENYFTKRPEFNVISMGMSGDYKIALDEGTTMVRIGSLLFAH